MSNEGIYQIDLVDVAGQSVPESGVKISFIRVSDGGVVDQYKDLTFPPPHRFSVPAFPEKNLFCEVTAPRFRLRISDIFTLTDGATISDNKPMFRQPKKWNASFASWNDLPSLHLPLKSTLEKSSNVKVKGGKLLGKFTEDTYDSADDTKTILAKAALLNLYIKLTEMIEPMDEAEPWFSFVCEIIEIGRERFIAIVDARMDQIVRTISANIGEFPEYKKTTAQNHFNNFPAVYKVVKSRMVSVKSREDHGNVQLTIAPGKDSLGNEIFLLDADIDENGKLMAHLADLFKHKFTGGTHPFDIHEYLVVSKRTRPLGYTLV